jgi:hypothetical protein
VLAAAAFALPIAATAAITCAAAVPAADPGPPDRAAAPAAVPAAAVLPELGTAAELEAAAAAHRGAREPWGTDDEGRVRGWAMAGHGPHAFPLFTPAGDLLGVYVSNVGIVPLADYQRMVAIEG